MICVADALNHFEEQNLKDKKEWKKLFLCTNGFKNACNILERRAKEYIFHLFNQKCQ